MAIDTTIPRSRRAFLGAGFGAVAAAVAGSLGRPQPVAAGTGDVVLGGANTYSGSVTSITNTDGNAFAASGSGVASYGVRGDSDFYGVYGNSTSNYGVYGNTASGNGVTGSSTSGRGVAGSSGSGNGVYGHTASDAASGVYGEALSGGYGVAGRSNAGPLVNGAGAAGTLGDNTTNGIGVWARSEHGIALFADPVNPDAVALKANGRHAVRTQWPTDGKGRHRQRTA